MKHLDLNEISEDPSWWAQRGQIERHHKAAVRLTKISLTLSILGIALAALALIK